MTNDGDMPEGQGGDRNHRSPQERPLQGTSVIESTYLLEGRNEVQIRHAGEIYRLRVTKNGKLILNK